MKRITIITLYPNLFQQFFSEGVIGRIKEFKNFEIDVVNLRDYGLGKHKTVDDRPYSGGPGMLIRADVLRDACVSEIKKFNNSVADIYPEKIQNSNNEEKIFSEIIYTAPFGQVWSQDEAKKLSLKLCGNDSPKQIIFICGRFEGIDERFIKKYVDKVYSLGDFVLAGGEIPVMALIESTLRLIPGILRNHQSVLNDSFSHVLLEGAQYTRPLDFEGDLVPEVLLSGNHQEILDFKADLAFKRAKEYRPDQEL